jgi:thiamine pyrophosphate-dependent acetolactate synthase large subunit-like protein
MIDSFEALKIIARHRGKAIVVAATTAGREWGQISTNTDLDLPWLASMGKASSVGLGLALARPETKVLVFDGDGSLVMNLGTLLTISNMAPPNLIHFLFENQIYRTTGGQPIPNAGRFSFAALARDAGYAHVYEFDELKSFEDKIETIMTQAGPTFVHFKVPSLADRTAFVYPRLGQTPEIISRLNAALGKCTS